MQLKYEGSIVIEGHDFSGKSSVARHLQETGIVTQVFEGPSPELRSSLKLGMPAEDLARAYLEDNKGWGSKVLSKESVCLVRYYWSSLAYSAISMENLPRRHDPSEMSRACKQPKAWVLLHCSHEVLLERLNRRPLPVSSSDRLLAKAELHRRLASEFHLLSESATTPVMSLDTSYLTSEAAAKVIADWLLVLDESREHS